MSKIDLVPVTGAQNISAINDNFAKVAEALNDKALYRDNPAGQPNLMKNDLDMNGKRIYNLPAPIADNEPARKIDLDNISSPNKLLRVQDIDIPALPDAVDRRNKLVSFDNEGKPQVQFPSNDSATQLRIDLADPTKGSDLIKTKGGDVLTQAIPWITPYSKGALANGTFNDGPAEIAAQAAAEGKGVLYPSAPWNGTAPTGSIYPSDSKLDSLSYRITAGTPSAPVTEPAPVVFLGKHSSSTREGTTTRVWDGGALYGDLYKVSGTSYGATLTGVARHYGGAGDMIGVHGRGQGNHRNAKTWGMWSYAFASNTADRQIDLIGHEINIVNRWTGNLPFTPDSSANEGEYRGLVIATADSGNRCNTALSINAQAGTGGFNHGIRIKSTAIEGDTVAGGKTGHIWLEGRGTPTNGRPTGIIFGEGYFRVGVDFRDMNQNFDNNNAIALKTDHRISWTGTGDTQNHYLSRATGTTIANLQNLTLGVNGVQVVGARKTGWGAPTGTNDRTAFATYTAPTISSTPTQAEVQALANACQTASRHLAALINDVTLHGLIGT